MTQRRIHFSVCATIRAFIVLLVLLCAWRCHAAVWQDTILDTYAAGGISATRFDGGKIAVAYARPASNHVVVLVMTPGGGTVRTVLNSAVKAQNVELCAASPDDSDLFAVWDDSAGNLFWARKNDSWTVRAVEQEQGVSNSFALQLHKISYSFQNPLPPFNTITVQLTVPIIYYRNETVQQLERVYISGYNPGAGTFTWSREVIPSGFDSGKGCDSSSFANDMYHHIVSHCAGAGNTDMLTARLPDGWTNFTVCDIGGGTPLASFEQGPDDLPRMAFQRWFASNVTVGPITYTFTNSGAIYFDSSQTEFNLIELGLLARDNGAAPALKLNHLGRPLAAYYWSGGTVHCATRGGKLGGYVWDAETCGTGSWDGVSSSIDAACGVSNTYVFYLNAFDQRLHLASSDFVPPDKRIYGVVSNLWTGEPVTNASLVAIESNDWVMLAKQTGTNGAYAFEYIPTGTYTITCSASNYFTQTTNVPLTSANSPYALVFPLVPVPEPVGSLVMVLCLLSVRGRAPRAILCRA